jgi:RNA polymerase sigma factor (sigma-70 family)
MVKAKTPIVDPGCSGRLRNGDPEALGELYDGYVDRLFVVALGLTNDRELARDGVQEAFVALWNYRGTIGDVQYPLAYLTRVLRSALLKKLKADQPKKHILLEEALTALDGSREDQLIALETDSEIATRLNHAIDRLTSRQKLILRLHYYEGLSYAQIAERLSMNYQSVNNLAFRTIRQLRSVMACFLFF